LLAELLDTKEAKKALFDSGGTKMFEVYEVTQPHDRSQHLSEPLKTHSRQYSTVEQ